MGIKNYLHLSLILLAGMAYGDNCQITSPLPVPVSISGCTYASTASATAYFPFGISASTATITSLSPNLCVATDGHDNLITQSCGSSSGGGGGGSVLAVGTGSVTGYTGTIISSPTTIILFDSSTFKNALQGSSTDFVSLNNSSVTLQGVVTAASLGALTGNQTITISGDSTGSGATSIAVTAAATQANIHTLTAPVTNTSSVTVNAEVLVVGTMTANVVSLPSIVPPISIPGKALFYNDSTDNWPSFVPGNQNGAAYNVVGTSIPAGQITPGHVPVFVSTNGAVADGGVNGGEGNAILNQDTLQAGSSYFTQAGFINGELINYGFSIFHTTFTVLGVSSSVFTNVSSFTITGAQINLGAATDIVDIGQGLTFSSVVVVGAGNSITLSTYTSIVYLSPNTTQTATAILPLASLATGQFLEVYDIGTGTAAAIIQTQSTDLIGSTGTIKLFAKGQGGGLRAYSNPTSAWMPAPGFNANPGYLGNIINIGAAVSLTASSDVVTTGFIAPGPFCACGFVFNTGTPGTTFLDAGLYDGVSLQLVYSSAAIVAVNGKQSILTTTPYCGGPGYYLLALQAANVTYAYEASTNAGQLIGCYRNTTSSPLALPNPISTGTSGTTKCPSMGLIMCGGSTT